MASARLLWVLLCSAAAPAWAQSSASPLNLEVPAAAPAPPGSTTVAPKPNPAPAPSAPPETPDLTLLAQPYDTTYGARRDAAEKGCDDNTYGQAQVHGSVGMGVASAKGATANYETAELNVSKALGSCDDPKGNVGASIRVTKSNVDVRRRGRP